MGEREQRVFRCGGSFRGCVCRLPPIVQVDGNWYCRVHDPAARAKRATALSEKWVAERKAQKRERSKQVVIESVDMRNGRLLDGWKRDVQLALTEVIVEVEKHPESYATDEAIHELIRSRVLEAKP